MTPGRRSERTRAIIAGDVGTLGLWFAGPILLDLLTDPAGSPGPVSLLRLLSDIALPVGVTASAWPGMWSTWELSVGVPVEGDADADGFSWVSDRPSDRRVLLVAPVAALLADRLVWERVDDRSAPLSGWLSGDRDIALCLIEAVLALIVVGASVRAGLAARVLLVR